MLARRGSQWVPFFLVLLFYQGKMSMGTSLDSHTGNTTSTIHPNGDVMAAMNNPGVQHLNMDNTIPTVSTDNVLRPNIEGTTSKMREVSNEIPVAPTLMYTTRHDETIPNTRGITEAVPQAGTPRLFQSNPDGGIQPVHVPNKRRRGKTILGGRIRPLFVVERRPARRNGVLETRVRTDRETPAPVTTRLPDIGETTSDGTNDIPNYSENQLEYLTSYIEQKHGNKVDFANLLTQYTQVCPVNEACNLLTPSIQKYDSTFKNEFECPYFCSCEVRCLGSSNCCPGSIYAYTEHECLNTRLHPSNGESSYLMVSTCPMTFQDESVRRQCEGRSNVQPVTSHDTMLTYKNRFCSLCHGEANVTDWAISVNCPSEDIEPLDDFKSYAEMKEYLDRYDCEVVYDLDYHKLKPPKCNPPISNSVKIEYIGQCNSTGLWFEDDSDIRWACEHFNKRPFLTFKNIFCFLCNPSIVSTNMPLTMDRCNISQEWDVYDPVLESACANQPALPRLFPYKNVYCLMCNGVNTLTRFRRNMFKTETMEVAIDEAIHDNRGIASLLTLDLDFIRHSKLSDLMDFIMNAYAGEEANTDLLDNAFEKIDIPNEETDKQINYYLSICGNFSSCDASVRKDSGFGNPICKGDGFCSCNPQCIEVGNCCVDFLLEHRPYSCFSRSSILQFRPKTMHSMDNPEEVDESCYRFVDKCVDQSHMNVNVNFTESQLRVLSALPVTHGRTTYRNISYMMCNLEEIMNIHIDITLQCETLFEKSLIAGLSNFQTLLDLTKQFCKATFISDRSILVPPPPAKWGYTNKVDESDIDALVGAIDIPTSMASIEGVDTKPETFVKCNQTGIWRNTDEGIISICEKEGYLGTILPEYRINDLIYKNYACYICNPEVDEDVFAEEDVISSCNVTGLVVEYYPPLENIETLCRETEQHARWLPFKNFYCSSCNLPSVSVIGTERTSQIFFSGDATEYQPSYRRLFSLSFNDFSRIINEQTIPDCTNGTYDYALERCRPLYCSPGRILQNDTCKPLFGHGSDLSYKLALNLRLVNHGDILKGGNTTGCETQEIQTTEMLDLRFVLEDFKQAVLDVMVMHALETSHFLHGCQIDSDIHCLHPDSGSDKLVYINMLTELRLQCTLFVFKTRNKADLESALVDILMDSYTVSTEGGHNVCLKATPRDNSVPEPDVLDNRKCGYREPLNLFLASQQFDVDRFFTCVQIKLDESEYKINNETGDLILVTSNIVIKRKFYQLNGTVVKMCLDDYTQLTSMANNTVSAPVDTMLDAYTTFSAVCTLLSMVCLLATFVTYCLFHSLRTVPGKNNMALCFCLFCAQGTLQFGMSVNNSDTIPVCTIMGMLVHYFWLATFFAMNICSFHMFRVFCSNAMSIPSSSKRRFSKYIIFLFGVPLLIVAVTFTAFFVSSDGTYTGYGDTRCFLTNIYGIVCAFIIPSSAIFLANTIFFIAAFHKIRTSPRIQSSGDKREFFLYVKLCTVVGLAWPLQIVDAVLPLTLFSFFVVALNASQGVFIWLAYVCNKRVMFLYKKICSKDKTAINSGTSVKTNSTELTDRSNKTSA